MRVIRNPWGAACRALLAFLVLGASGFLPAQDLPGEDSLRGAWEQAIRQDPKTTLFEPVGERTWRFSTQRFPYDGTVELLTLNVEPFGPGEWGSPAALGVVEFRLPDMDEEALADYNYSYNRWRARVAMHYWMPEEGEWISQEEFTGQVMDEYAEGDLDPFGLQGYGGLGGWFPTFLLLGIVVLVFLVFLWMMFGKRGVRRNMDAVQEDNKLIMERQLRGLELAEKNTEHTRRAVELLEQILEELRRTGG